MISEDRYQGDVGFGSDGVHYALDGDGHLDRSKPLLWVADDPHPEAPAGPSGEQHDAGGFYRAATQEEAANAVHGALYHVNHVEIEFGDGQEPIRVSDAEADAVRALLAQRRGEA